MEQKLLFIVNPKSGSHTINFSELIREFFSTRNYLIEIFELDGDSAIEKIKEVITASNATKVIAVGGDGTLKLVAECLLRTNIPIGLIPAGSANGMARELGVPTHTHEALELILSGTSRSIHVVIVNGELCIHLADIGYNAYVVKKFDDLPQRGMWGYAKAAWQAFWRRHKMDVVFITDEEEIKCKAAMVVIANGTMYGTGVKINPHGKLDDDFFEVILIKAFDVMEILKIRFTSLPFNPEKIETFKTRELQIKTKHRVHFQVDGEYKGKVNRIAAEIIPDAIRIIV
ncbi:diacylglycerol kinase (ATP) [Pedobacter sp. CG_S7]|uniref:diacylglycerol/lipid kinase family protein n=1 Tax=Pedobacter sp. CG_S7 TaxID=3143930 RepID=UPI00339AF11C